MERKKDLRFLWLGAVVAVLFVSCPKPMDDHLLSEVEDTSPPRITITTPDLNVQNFIESTITIKGTIIDYSNDSGTIAGSVESAVYADEFGFLGISGDIDIGEDGSFEISFSALTIQNTFTIVITVTDWNGNTSKQEVTFWKDSTGPFIIVDDHDPDDFNYYSSAVDADIVITGSVGTDAQSFKYDVEWSGTNILDQNISFDSSTGDFSFGFNPVEHEVSGTLTFWLKAIDSETNISNKLFELEDDPVAPTMTGSLSWDNSTISLAFSEPVCHAGGTAPQASDFTIDFDQGSGTATGAEITGIASGASAGTTAMQFTISITGTPDGSETIDIHPVSGMITDRVGNPLAVSESIGPVFLNDKSSPSVVSVSSPDGDNSYYKEGDVVPITVEFSEDVTIIDTPSLSLNSGGTAEYTDGNGSSVLSFDYTVSSGDNAGPLNYLDTDSLTGSLEDSEGNPAVLTLPDTGDSASLGVKNLTVDTTPPEIKTTTLTSPNGEEEWAGGSTHTIEWNSGDITDANLGDTPITLGYTIDGAYTEIVSGIVVEDADGNGSYDWTVPYEDSTSVKVIITATDEAGNYVSDSSDTDFTIDSTPPEVPTVDDNVTNDTTPEITGTATVGTGEVLTVEVNGIEYTAGDENLVLDDTAWTLTIPAENELSDNTYEVVAVVTDSAGNESSDTSNSELTVDTTPPAVPTVDNLVTSDTTPAVTGTAVIEDGENLTVEVNGETYAGDDITFSGDDWSVSISAALDEGTYEVVAVVTDSAGNESSDTSSSELTVDTTPPEIKTTTLTSPNGEEEWAGGSTHTIEWNSGDITDANLGDTPITLGYTIDGAYTEIVSGIVVEDVDGNGSYDWTVPYEDSTSVKVIITATDEAGNYVSDSSDTDFTIDSTPPAVPTVDNLVTSDTTPAVTGTAVIEDGENLTVEVNGETYAGDDITFSGDNWSVSISAALDEGTYEVVAVVTDSAGNESSDTSNSELTVDTTPPAVPTVDNLVTSDTTPAVTGTAVIEDGENLTVEVNGETYAGDDITFSGDDWSVSISAALDEGTYEVVAVVTDSAGNESSDTSSSELTVDTTPPEIKTTTLTSPNGEEEWAGGSTHTIEWNSGDITDANLGDTPITLGYTIDGAYTEIVSGIVVEDADGNGSYDWTVPYEDSTSVKVIITVTDEAGNYVSDSSDADFTIN